MPSTSSCKCSHTPNPFMVTTPPINYFPAELVSPFFFSILLMSKTSYLAYWSRLFFRLSCQRFWSLCPLLSDFFEWAGTKSFLAAVIVKTVMPTPACCRDITYRVMQFQGRHWGYCKARLSCHFQAIKFAFKKALEKTQLKWRDQNAVRIGQVEPK